MENRERRAGSVCVKDFVVNCVQCNLDALGEVSEARRKKSSNYYCTYRSRPLTSFDIRNLPDNAQRVKRSSVAAVQDGSGRDLVVIVKGMISVVKDLLVDEVVRLKLSQIWLSRYLEH